MVVLHGGGGVEPGQAVAGLDLVTVVRPSMVEVMAEAGDDHGQALDLPELLPPGGVGDDGEHELTNIEGVSPVVVGDTPVITTDGAQPPENI